MRVIKPYGRSVAEDSTADGLRRRLQPRPRNATHGEALPPEDIKAFTTAWPEVVIAQWISAIDKIATKPSRTPRPRHGRLHHRVAVPSVRSRNAGPKACIVRLAASRLDADLNRGGNCMAVERSEPTHDRQRPHTGHILGTFQTCAGPRAPISGQMSH